MPIVAVVLILAGIGALLWWFNVKLTIVDGTIKQIVNIVVIGAVIIWLLKIFGVWDMIMSVTV